MCAVGGLAKKRQHDRVTRNRPSTLTSSMAAQSPSECLRDRAQPSARPALLTSTSHIPKRSSTRPRTLDTASRVGDVQLERDPVGLGGDLLETVQAARSQHRLVTLPRQRPGR